MSLTHDTCRTCDGRGRLDCNACHCEACHGQRSVLCSGCKDGYLKCQRCTGTGKTAVLSGWGPFVRSVEVACTACSSGRTPCPVCGGSKSVVCSACQVGGSRSPCRQCGDTRMLFCEGCRGTGKLENEWATSLRSMSVTDLHFEHEKLRSNRTSLERRLSRLETEHDRAWDYYNHWQDRATDEGWLNAFYSADNEKPVDAAKARLEACAVELKELNEAFALVETYLRQRRQATAAEPKSDHSAQ
jgi:hypothetical protein